MSMKKTENKAGKRAKRGGLTVMRTARGKNGLLSTGMIALVVAIVVVFNIAVNQLPSGVRQFDISTSKIYEISDTTREYLDQLDKDVTITVVAADENIDYRLSHFLDLYTALSDHLSLIHI